MSLKKPNKPFSSDLLAQKIRALDPGQAKRLLVAFSGGIDSVVLLHALTQWQDSPFVVHAVHINHGLHADAAVWTEHCRSVCREWSVPLSVLNIEVTDIPEMGVEAAARRKRYEALASLVTKEDVLVTAHHQDDQAETLMLQLMRGSGVPGLAAMPEKSEFAAGLHLRPLLSWSRMQLEAYAKSNGLSWQEDPSNQDTRFARNYVRHEILPVLRTRWPQAVDMIHRSASHLAEASQLLAMLASLDLDLCQGEPDGLSLKKLARLPEIRLKNLLRYYIRDLGLSVPSTRQLSEIVHLVFSPPREHHALVCWPGVEAHLYQDQLLITAPLGNIDNTSRIPWNGRDMLEVPHTGWVVSGEQVQGRGLAAEPFGQKRVTVGLRKGGERCCVVGRGPQHHSLKKLFQEAGVSPWARARMPLIFVDDQLAAIGDRWVCTPFAATQGENGIVVSLKAV